MNMMKVTQNMRENKEISLKTQLMLVIFLSVPAIFEQLVSTSVEAL